MWIMISGPYTTGAANEAGREANLLALNQAAVALFRAGHVPIIGVNASLPMVRAAGEDTYDEIMMPMSLALVDRCDACLRIGGASRGADEEVDRFLAAGKPIYYSLAEIPPIQKE